MTEPQKFFIRQKHSELTLRQLAIKTGCTQQQIFAYISSLLKEFETTPNKPMMVGGFVNRTGSTTCKAR